MPFWRNAGGGAVNSVAAGDVYNPWRGSYAPGGVTGTRLGIGAVQQLGGPIGSLAGWLANKIYSGHNREAQAFDNQLATDNIIGPQRQTLNGLLMQQAMNRNYAPQPQGPVQDVNWTPQTMQPHLTGTMSGPSNYGSIANTSLASLVNRQQFDPGIQQTHVNDVNWTPTANHNLSFRGSNGQMVGGAPQGGFGGNPLAAGIGRGGAGVIQGEAAQDYIRAAHQSIFANRQQGTDAAGHRNVY